MSAFFATAADTATLAALGRFHTSTKDSQAIHHSTGRQRSSSFTDRGANGSLLLSSTAPLSASKKLAMNNDTLNKGLHQHENTVAHRDLPARQPSLSYSGPSIAESTNLPKTSSLFTSRAHQEDFDRKKYPSAQDPHSHSTENSDIPAEQTPTICTGRSRSNTLTTSSADAVDVAEASISDQIEHVMRPRRPSLAIRLSGFIVSPDEDLASNHATVQRTSIHSYPPLPLVPQYQDMEENKGGVDITASVSISPSTSPSSLPWTNLQLGFLPRITVLIGLFGLSLGGLFLLAKVLPPLSLPKSIDDVKIDAAILQEFATATFEGWIRTFWVFSAVYIWKQCFGIPGSAFLNILAGALYGPWFGTVLTSVLTTLGSVLAYFMSFFLMEPIMNRYASGRLDQMRLQIQKKAMRSSSVTKSSAQDSTATSTAVQTSINVAIPSSTGTTLSISASTTASGSVVSSSTPGQRGVLLRTRSSSFTVRKTDLIEQQDLYSKPPSAMAPAAAAVYQTMHEESEIQESKSLLSEEKNVEGATLFTGHQDIPDGPHTSVMMGEQEEDQDDSDETSLFMQLLLIRLFPLTPYWFINLASPLVGVPVVPFMTSMLLGCMPYNYICAQAGAILSEIHELRDMYQQPWILFQIVVVLLLSTVAVLVSKRAKKQQKEQQSKSRSSEDERDATNDETTHRLLGSALEHHRHSREEPRDSISLSSLNAHQHSAVIDMSTYRY